MKHILISFSIAAILFSCSNSTSVDFQEKIESLENRIDGIKMFKPGLGVTMNQIQVYHTKFYFAMKSDNIELMQYIIHELDENFEAVVENHAMHDGVNLADLAQNTVLPALENLEEKVRNGDREDIVQAFENLTVNCNNCHATSDHAFIRIKNPEGNTYLNQDFNNFKK